MRQVRQTDHRVQRPRGARARFARARSLSRARLLRPSIAPRTQVATCNECEREFHCSCIGVAADVEGWVCGVCKGTDVSNDGGQYVGIRFEHKWSDGHWYSGTVTKQRGDQLTIVYDIDNTYEEARRASAASE